jgi:hypothetical protein
VLRDTAAASSSSAAAVAVASLLPLLLLLNPLLLLLLLLLPLLLPQQQFLLLTAQSKGWLRHCKVVNVLAVSALLYCATQIIQLIIQHIAQVEADKLARLKDPVGNCTERLPQQLRLPLLCMLLLLLLLPLLPLLPLAGPVAWAHVLQPQVSLPAARLLLLLLFFIPI